LLFLRVQPNGRYFRGPIYILNYLKYNYTLAGKFVCLYLFKYIFISIFEYILKSIWYTRRRSVVQWQKDVQKLYYIYIYIPKRVY